MEKWKEIGMKVLYPPILIVVLLFPIAIIALLLSMILLGTNSIVSYITYAVLFYALLIVSVRTPNIIKKIKTIKNENKYLFRYFNDPHLRINISLYGSLIFNVIYSFFQLGLGIIHNTFWYISMAIYYICLSIMRYFLVRYTLKHKEVEDIKKEFHRYIMCGIVLLVLNLALSVIIFFMVYYNRTFVHHEITTIAMAAYTFTLLTVAIVNIIRYRKYNRPVYSAAKIVSLVAACVSMLTLETTMLTVFGTSGSGNLNRILLSSSGGAISLFVISIAIYMIRNAMIQLRKENTTHLAENVVQIEK